MLIEEIRDLIQLMKNTGNTVVVTGAGISTEAGIPDFRSEKGIYTQMGGEDKVMSLININAFHRDPKTFYDFYWQWFDYPPTEPSAAHQVLARMEAQNCVRGIVTQNIDGLHEKAGSKQVIPIHGNSKEYICLTCGKIHTRKYAREYAPKVPQCEDCGSILKPNVVLFGESIHHFNEAIELIMKAECLLVIGSSLTVYPLAGFVQEFSNRAKTLAIINRGLTPLDHVATLKIEVGNATLGEILEQVFQGLIGEGDYRSDFGIA